MTTPGSVLLDTSVVIDLERLDLSTMLGSTPAVSAVTVAELAFGLDVDDLVKRRARTDHFYSVLRTMSVLAFDLEAAALRDHGFDPPPERSQPAPSATGPADRRDRCLPWPAATHTE